MGDHCEKRIIFEKLLLKKPFLYEIWISYVFFEIKKKFTKHAEKVILRAFVCLEDKTRLVSKVVLFQLPLYNLSFCAHYSNKKKFFSDKILLKDLSFFWESLFFHGIFFRMNSGTVSSPIKVKIDHISKLLFIKLKVGKLEDIIGITNNFNYATRRRIFFKFFSQVREESQFHLDNVIKKFLGKIFLKSVYQQVFFTNLLYNFAFPKSCQLNDVGILWIFPKFPIRVFFRFLKGLKRFIFSDPNKIKWNTVKKIEIDIEKDAFGNNQESFYNRAYYFKKIDRFLNFNYLNQMKIEN